MVFIMTLCVHQEVKMRHFLILAEYYNSCFIRTAFLSWSLICFLLYSLFNSYNPNWLLSTAYYRTDLYQRHLQEVWWTQILSYLILCCIILILVCLFIFGFILGLHWPPEDKYTNKKKRWMSLISHPLQMCKHMCTHTFICRSNIERPKSRWLGWGKINGQEQLANCFLAVWLMIKPFHISVESDLFEMVKCIWLLQ